jgi:hypothetical protein
MTENVFAGLEDEKPATGTEIRKELLDDARRGFAPIRKIFVQRPNTESVRASVLSQLVKTRQHRPLKTLLLLHALEPVLGDPLPLATWAKMLDTRKLPCSSAQASSAINALVRRDLATRTDQGQYVVVKPLLEDGSGEDYSRPGSLGSDVGRGYFTIPYQFWTEGLVDELSLPGTAMFLIMLEETTQNATFAMAVERASEWYGISERTAERGFSELSRLDVLAAHKQLVKATRSPTGLRAIYHRALTGPYSTKARAELQQTTGKAARRRAEKVPS